jgi:hypothetical protein
MAVGQYLGDGSTDGTSFGSSTTEKISFYGVTPIVQPAVTAIGTTTISQVATSGKWAFASSTAAQAFVARVRSIQDQLENLGLIDQS